MLTINHTGIAKKSLLIGFFIFSCTINALAYNPQDSKILTSGPNILQRDLTFFLQNNHIQTINDYAQWLEKNISYQKDIAGDIWEAPLQTLKRRYGDCEDFAILTANTLALLNYTPQVLLMLKENLAHAICIFKKDGRYLIFDNNRLIATPFQTKTALKNHLKTQYNYLAIRSIDYKENAWTQHQVQGVLVSGF